MHGGKVPGKGRGGPRVCSFFLQGIPCMRLADPEHTQRFTHGETEESPAFALDCEIIRVRRIDDAAVGQTVPVAVSIGVVDQRMETLLYARIRKPDRTVVADDSFARTRSGIQSDWRLGMPQRHVTSVVQQLVTEGDDGKQAGVLVGWSLASDLKSLGFQKAVEQITSGQRQFISLAVADGLEKNPSRLLGTPSTAAPEAGECDVVELQDFYRSGVRDRPVRLAEAHRFIFQREHDAHDAIDDARMTMELYLHWVKQGRPQVQVHTIGRDPIPVHTQPRTDSPVVANRGGGAAAVGHMLGEMNVGEGHAQATWLRVSLKETPSGHRGDSWVLLRQGKTDLCRVVRPFPVDLHFFQIQFEEFASDCDLEVLWTALRPRHATGDGVAESTARGAGAQVKSYSLKFRDRCTRDAYWGDVRERFNGEVKFSTTQYEESKPWVLHGGTSLLLGTRAHGPTYSKSQHGCVAHIWDELR
eukprot:TRINITY_DN3798_c3_g3_i1.p1 TRINITY_DN3798_c3_g3~~TRINITY_DN3798_c3_g3_i1.p1  ORF type:complete len:472 (+),score=160.19 TRINITY_DN3798_c3_g3_i1:46-1461(+)